ncbi:hypothetical protein [Pseudofulvibacter geojedonensis]|uniref:DUF3806 domain-containing protein n=1 Tax=Pseudofulvibacter geojedonensis TaxID=1123758 RepID=A0ABW3HZC1_9FLAO
MTVTTNLIKQSIKDYLHQKDKQVKNTILFDFILSEAEWNDYFDTLMAKIGVINFGVKTDDNKQWDCYINYYPFNIFGLPAGITMLNNRKTTQMAAYIIIHDQIVTLLENADKKKLEAALSQKIG